MTKILIPNFGSIDADTLSELLANIIKAVDDVETARNLFQSIASNLKPLSQMDSRNAIALHDALNVAGAAQDDACRHLADRCTQLRDLLRKK